MQYICTQLNVNFMVDTFSHSISRLFDLHALVHNKVFKTTPTPWITVNIKLFLNSGIELGAGFRRLNY